MFVSDGSLVTKTPISLTSSSWFPSIPPMSTHGWPSAYAGIYSRQLWVYVVVNKLAKAAARLPLPVYQRNDLDRPRVDEHPMARLLAQPNPGMSGFDMWLWTSSTFDIYGDTFWLKKRQGGRVVALFPLHPSSMTHERGAWQFDNGTLALGDIPDADLVRFRNFHPDSLTRGLSPLEPLRATLENEWSARVATSSFWQNGARPGTALVHPGNLSVEAAERLKTQYDAASGGAGRTGSTVVLEEGMKPEKLTLTAEEAQYIETRKLNREEVCAAYDVPPPVVHILDRATFSNITEQMRSMYRDTMAPRLKHFEAAIEIGLRQAEWPNDNVYAEFLMDEVLRGDFETRQDALAKASYMTIAEKRKVENLPFIEGTDRIFLNAAEQALTAPQNSDAPAAPPFQTVGLPALIASGVITEDDARRLLGIPGTAPGLPAVPAPVVRSVMGRLSWQDRLDQIDAAGLVAGLSEADAKAVIDALGMESTSDGSVESLRTRIRGMTAKGVRVKAPDLTDHQAMIGSVLRDYFAAQRDAGGDGKKWDARLTAELHAAALLVSSSVGKATVRDLGFDPSTYDVERTAAFLLAMSTRLAENINKTTREQLAAADEAAPVFEQATTSRSDGISLQVAALVAGFAVVEAGRRAAEQGAAPTKTWITGVNPRPEHAALDGETVGIDDAFSNGAGWPGEDGEFGCNCSVEVGV